MRSHPRYASVLGLCAFVAIAALSCGGDDDGDDTARLEGTATFPADVGGGPVANRGFNVVDLNQAGAPVVASGVTDATGKYVANVNPTSVVAVIANRPNPDPSSPRVSGLLAASDDQTKNLDGRTDIACEAGVSAVADGSITDEQLRDRIANLEDAAADEVPATDFTDPASVSAAATRVRQRTNDGANPA